MPHTKNPSRHYEYSEKQGRALARAYKRFKPPLNPHHGELSHSNRNREYLQPLIASSFDWREKIAIRPAGHQGDCYACTGFAIAAAIEAALTIAGHGGASAVSAGYIHTCLGHKGETDYEEICQTGVDLYAALLMVQESGYALSEANDYPFPSVKCSTTTANGRIANFAPVPDADKAKLQIVQNGPILADMYIWGDFFTYTTKRSPSYSPDMTKDGPYLHTVCVIGYSPNGWLIKNSYGSSGWGDGQGFATIAYDTCALIGAPPPENGYPRQTYSLSL